MTISEIQQLENSRKSPDTFGRIHFIKEGNFYRAHDVSAWLITMMPFSEAIKNVSIIAKKLKDGYISNHALHRIETKLSEMDFSKPWRIIRSVNSYLGIFQHTNSYNIRRRLLMTSDIMRYCVFNRDMTQAYDRRKFYKVNPKRGFGG